MAFGFIERDGVFLRAPIERLQEYCRITREIDEPSEDDEHSKLRGVIQFFQVGRPAHTNEKGILGWIKYYGTTDTKQKLHIAHSLLMQRHDARNSNNDPRVAATGEIDVDEMPLPPRRIVAHRTGTWCLLTDPSCSLDGKKTDRIISNYVQRYEMAVAAIKQKNTDDMESRKKTLMHITPPDDSTVTLETYVTNRVKFAVSRARMAEARDVKKRCMSVIAHEMLMMQAIHLSLIHI